MRYVWMAVLLLLLTTTAQASWLQYDTSNGHITGGPRATAESFGVVPGRDVIEDTGLDLTNPVWPVPSACTKGQQGWTELSSGLVLPLVVRDDLTWFSSATAIDEFVWDSLEMPIPERCQIVYSWNELRKFVEGTITGFINQPQYTAVLVIDHLYVIGQIIAGTTTCPPGETATCAAINSKLSTLTGLNGVYPEVGPFNAFLGWVLTFIDEAVELRDDSCTAGKTSFCP